MKHTTQCVLLNNKALESFTFLQIMIYTVQLHLALSFMTDAAD